MFHDLIQSLYMKTTSPFSDKLSSVADNLMSLHDYLKDSYTEQKKRLTEDLSHFKEGLSDVIDKTGSYLAIFSSPVNNFLKDIGQIEEEFRCELSKNGEHFICLDGQMVSANDILSMPLEENY
jgi:hypothetical protein